MRTSILTLARLSFRLFIHLSNKTVLRISIIFECSSQAIVWVWAQHFCDCSGSDSSASEDGLQDWAVLFSSVPVVRSRASISRRRTVFPQRSVSSPS